MPIAAPLLVPFAELVGITTAGLALSQISDAVQSYMKSNPEQSMKILTMLSPELGIASMMKKKTTKPKVEEEEVEKEPKLTAEEKREKFIELSKKRGRGRQDFIDLAQDLGLAKKGSEEQPPEDDEEEQILTGAQKTQLFKNLFREGGKNIDYARLGRATKRGNQGLYQEGLEALKKTLKGKKDGGRIGYAIGGLTDRAQGIYSSMLNAGFGEQAIIDTLNQMGLYNQTPVVTTPVVTTPEVVNTQPNIINQQMDRGGGDQITTPPAVDPYSGLGYSSANFGLSANPLDGSNVMDYEADAYEQGRTFTGQLNKIGLGIFSALKNIPTPFNIVRMGIQKAQELARQKEIEKARQEEAIAQDTIREMVESNRENKTGGYQSTWGGVSDFMGGGGGGSSTGGSPGSSGPGGSDSMGSFAKGGRVGYQAGGVATPEQYAKALQQVGAGSALDKLRSTGDYVKNYVSNVGQSILNKNPAIRGIASFYGVGKPISSFSDFSSGSQQAIKDAVMRTVQNPTLNQYSKTNIPMSSYTNYFADKGKANTRGIYDTGYISRADQFKDMVSALAGNEDAIARMTLGRFNVNIDPTSGVGYLKDKYDFSKQMPGGKAYDINMQLPQDFVKQILNDPTYQKTTGYTPPTTQTTSSIPQFYQNNPGSYDFDKFKEAYAFATGQQNLVSRTPDGQIVTNFGNWDPSNTYSNYRSDRTSSSSTNPFFSQFTDPSVFNKNTLINMYGAPGTGKNYFADGGLATMFSEKR